MLSHVLYLFLSRQRLPCLAFFPAGVSSISFSAHVSMHSFVCRYGTLGGYFKRPHRYLLHMPVRKSIPYPSGLYFISFTCYNWLPLIAQVNGYDLIYKWFDYLKAQQHEITGFVIMPSHVHMLIDFSSTHKKINTIIGDGKRFMAYDIIRRLKERGSEDMLSMLKRAASVKDKKWSSP